MVCHRMVFFVAVDFERQRAVIITLHEMTFVTCGQQNLGHIQTVDSVISLTYVRFSSPSAEKTKRKTLIQIKFTPGT